MANRVQAAACASECRSSCLSSASLSASIGNGIDAFNPIVDLPSGVNLNFFASAFVLGTEAYPRASIPLREVVAKAAAGINQAKPVRIFSFQDIRDAHRRLESGDAGGKMVVLVE